MAWKTMNSAPLDGTRVDLWNVGGFRLVDCYFDNGDWRDGTGERISYNHRVDGFTHWDYPPDEPK